MANIPTSPQNTTVNLKDTIRAVDGVASQATDHQDQVTADRLQEECTTVSRHRKAILRATILLRIDVLVAVVRELASVLVSWVPLLAAAVSISCSNHEIHLERFRS
jgi:hypothetical protein